MLQAEESGVDLVLIAQIAQGHGSAMRIGSFDSSNYKGTLVLDLSLLEP